MFANVWSVTHDGTYTVVLGIFDLKVKELHDILSKETRMSEGFAHRLMQFSVFRLKFDSKTRGIEICSAFLCTQEFSHDINSVLNDFTLPEVTWVQITFSAL